MGPGGQEEVLAFCQIDASHQENYTLKDHPSWDACGRPCSVVVRVGLCSGTGGASSANHGNLGTSRDTSTHSTRIRTSQMTPLNQRTETDTAMPAPLRTATQASPRRSQSENGSCTDDSNSVGTESEVYDDDGE